MLPQSTSNTIGGASKQPERVCTDVAAPMKVESTGRSKYFVTTMDECSGYSLMQFINRKIETENALIEMVREPENLLSACTGTLKCIGRKSVKRLQFDGGGEYVSHIFHTWLKQRGMIYEVTTAYSPESNEKTERLNMTLVDMTRTMLTSPAVIRKDLWAEAINTACYS